MLVDGMFLILEGKTGMLRLLEACPRLMAVGCFCIGTNQVNLDAALVYLRIMYAIRSYYEMQTKLSITRLCSKKPP